MNEETDRTDLEDALLAYVTNPRYHPVKPRVIAKKLGLPKQQHADLKRVIKKLVKKGRLAYGSKHLVKPVAPPTNRSGPAAITGIFRRAAAGFGFVRRSGTTRAEKHDDIFIPAHQTLDAANGDLVAVRIKGKRRRGEEVRWAGEIVEILERETHQFVGVYDEQNGFGVVRVDGSVFAQAISVGDPGAKNAQPGDKVVIEMVRFPSHTHDGEAVIVEVLGPRGDPAVDTLSILREFNLPEQFPADVLESARQQAEQFDEAIQDDRQDLTGD